MNAKEWLLCWLVLGPAAGAAAAAVPPAGGPAEQPAQYVVEPRRFATPPALTGRLDDPVWQQAALITSFTQYEPQAGAPASERTELRIGYDARNLYFGFRCYDRHPNRIVASTMSRDGDLTYEDNVSIILDTFHDHSNGFLFSVNPLGAKFDALVRHEGDEVNVYWDGMWEAATSRDEQGWTAELVIPFKTLRFPAADPLTWGFNARRLIARRNEDSFWKPMERNGYFGRYRISQYGEMRGLSGLTSSGRFVAVPYASARDRHDQRTHGLQDNAGGELKVSLTSTLTADLTARTDFAEAEADLQQINLTRNRLKYPEKRAFFLEGSNLFYFGDRATGLGLETLRDHFAFFFSRQIGLTADGLQEVPVLGGGKLSGKLGSLGVGVLNLTTQPLRFVDASGNRAFQPRTNYSVVRLKEDLFERSSIGMMALGKEGAGDHDEGLGVDWDFGVTPNLSTGGFVAKTRTAGLAGRDTAGLVDLLYKQGIVSAFTEYAQFGQNFNPEMGFQATPGGIKKSESNVAFSFPAEWGELHRVVLLNDFDHVTDSAGHLITQFWKTEIGFVGTSNGGMALISDDDLEVLTTPFNIYKNVTIPRGTYRFRNIFLGMATDYAKPIGLTLWYDYGDFWDGKRLHTLLATGMHPVRGFQATLIWERSSVRLREGRFITNLLSADLVYSFSPNLFVRTLTQWNRVDNFRSNVMLDWTYRPGSDFYLVYNDVRDLDPNRRALPFSPQLPGRSVTAKLGYRLDF